MQRELLTAAGIFGVASLPYAYAALTAPDGLVYTGLMFNVPDHAQYWSWVTASRHGFLISNTMTPEPNPPVFMNAMTWGLARVQEAFGLGFPALFQVWRAAATLLLVPVVFMACRALAADDAERRTATIVALTGAGLGWILVVVKKATGAADVPWPLDVYIVEPNTFWTLLSYPYYAFAEALLLLTLLSVWSAHARGGRWSIAVAASGAILLGLCHAYDLVIVYAVTGAYLVVTWLRARRFPTRLGLTALLLVAGSAPFPLYFLHLTSADPLWRAVLAQYPNAGVYTPAPHHLLVLMGVPLVLGLVGLPAMRARREADAFVVTWALVGALLIYLPTVYQVKLLAGWQLPIALLAARGWHVRVLPALRRLGERPLLRVLGARRVPATMLLVALIAPTNAYLYAWRFVELGRHRSPYYVPRDGMAALDWLARHTRRDDVVLAPLELGRFVPNYGGTRAYLAHWAMTNRYFERVEHVDRFFDPATPDAWRDDLMRAEGITLLLRAGPAGRGATVFDPGGSSLFAPLLVLPDAQIYASWRRAERPEP